MFMLAAFIVAAEPIATNLTPESAVITALAGNRDLIAARFAIHQAEGRLKQAGLWPNPELEISQQNDRAFANEGEYNFSTGLRQRFPVTGRLAKAKSLARVDVALALAEVRNQERLLAGQVLDRSRQLLVAQEKFKANQEIQDTLQQLVQASEKRIKAAEVSPADVNLTKLELQKVSLAQAVLINKKGADQMALNRLLGRDPRTPVEISGTLAAEFDTNQVMEMSRQVLAQRPDRQMAALGVNRAAAEIRLARAEKWEDWTVGFNYSRDNSQFVAPVGNKRDNFFGVSLSIPLPLWNRNQGNISAAQATQQRAEAELNALDLGIVTEVQSAADRLQRLADILRQYREESITLAQENISLLQKGYSEGLISMTAVIQSQQQYIELRQGYLDTLGEYFSALTEWQTAAGLLPHNPTNN